jgi:HlyD family secretion protein
MKGIFSGFPCACPCHATISFHPSLQCQCGKPALPPPGEMAAILPLIDSAHAAHGNSLSILKSDQSKRSRRALGDQEAWHSWRRALLTVLIITGLALSLTITLRARNAESGIRNWRTVSISRGSIIRVLTATGTVDPVSTVQVGSYVSGPITAIFADYNSPVKAGQLIAKIDPRPFQVKVDEGKAALANVTAQLHKDLADAKYRLVAYQRDARLLNKRAVSQDAVDSAQSAYEQATAQVELDRATIEQQQASLKDAELNLRYTDIVSPVNGTVIAREVDVGQTVAASFQTPTLFLIAKDLTQMLVDSNVSEADIGEVREGQKVTFTVDTYEYPFTGLVTQVRRNPTTVQNVVTYDVVVAASNPQLLLAPGMTANVKIVTEERENMLRAPLQAVRYESGADPQNGSPLQAETAGAFLWVLDRGRRERLPVRTGIYDTH